MSNQEEQLHIQIRQQEAVTELGLLALSGADLKTIMNEAVQRLKDVLNVEYTKVLELLPGGKEVILRAGKGWNENIVIDKSTVDTGANSQAGYTLASKKPVIVKDLRTESRFNGPPLLTSHQVISGMSCIIWGKGKPYGVLGIHTTQRRDFTSNDVTFLQAMANTLATAIQRKEDEQKLQESEVLKSAILESSLDAIITINQRGQIIEWNLAAERIFGYPRDQVMGKEMAPLIVPKHLRAAHHQGLARYLATGVGPLVGKLVEVPALRADGTEFLSELTLAHVQRNGTSLFSATMRDITNRKKAEEAVRKSEARFRATFDEAALPMAITDLNGRWVELNHVFLETFGYSYEEIWQHEFWQITHPDDRESSLKSFAKLKEGVVDSVKREKRYIHKNGSIIWGVIHLSTIKDAAGKVQNIIGAIQDITDRKQAEEELQYRNSLLKAQQEVSPLGVLVVSHDGVILSYNQLFMDMWKISPGVVNKRVDDLLLEIVKDQLRDPEQFMKTVRETYQAGKTDQEKLFFKDGRIFKRYGARVQGDRGINYGYVWFFQDITEQEGLARQKDDFIGIASHELKTPVTSIKAYAQILLNRFRESQEHLAAEMLAKMDLQIDKLTKLIVDLLDVTKIEQGNIRFQREAFDFNALVEAKVEEVQAISEKHQISVRLDQEVTVTGDRDRIGQVIINLLTNAIKYSRGADTIIVSTEIADGEVRFLVEDFGPGLSEEDQVKVFERFYRVGDARFETYPGIGLGLFISSSIIQRHHGKIGVDSKLGEGSTFYFSLPLD